MSAWRKTALIVVMAAVVSAGRNARAQQDAASTDSEQIRGRTEEIITSPEFRHLGKSGRRWDMTPPSDQEGSGGQPGEMSPEEARKEERRLRESKKQSGSDKGLARRLREWSRSMSRYRNRDKPARERGAPSKRPSSDIQIPQAFGGLGSVLGPLFHGLAWLLLAVAVGVIVWLIVKAVMDYERKPKANALDGATAAIDEAPDRAPGDVPADEFVARARELAAAGRYREAVASLLLGAMSHIERAGLIRFRRGLTHRDYLRAVRSRAVSYGPMSAMVGVYEPLGFGRREATQSHFETSLSQYEAGFRATAALEK